MKIIPASEPMPVENLIVTIYGPPGSGKTTTGCTADKPLLLDFDHGAYRASVRVDTVKVESWLDVARIKTDDLAPYNTIVVDTVGRCLDRIQEYAVNSDPKNARRDGAPSMQGYGVIKSTFIGWLKGLTLHGKDIVLISHSSEDRSGDDIIERLDIVGGSKGEIYKVSDVMGRIFIKNGKRVLSLDPTDTSFGKNPAQMQEMEIPDNGAFLLDVIAETKDRLNCMTESQVKRKKLLDEWVGRVFACTDAEDYTAMIGESQKVEDAIQRQAKQVLMDAARKAGLKFEGGAFVEVDHEARA